MANRTVTITGTNVGADVTTVSITCSSGNHSIATGVSRADLIAGYSFTDDDSHTEYLVIADSPCSTSVTVTVAAPTPTPTVPTPTTAPSPVAPSPTPIAPTPATQPTPTPEVSQPLGPSPTPAQTQGSNNYYVSAPQASLQDFCGQGWAVTDEVTGDGSSIALMLNETVYDNGGPKPGGANWFIVSDSPYNYGGSSSFTYWRIAQSGEVMSTGTFDGCTFGTPTPTGGQPAGNEY